MKPRITVIMGIYNCASTLPEALDSLLTQTYQGFKVILCDDGSTDNTFGIAEAYSNNHENIVVIKNDKNRGLSYSLNHCLKYSDTEYVARMDGDDVSMPTRFEKQIAFLDKHQEISIVSSAMVYFDHKGDFKQGNPVEYPTAKDFIHGSPFCHAPCLIRKQAYDAVKGYSEDENVSRGEDYHLWFKMYALGYKGYNFKEPLYKMRDDQNAVKRRKFKYRINEMYIKHIGYKMLGLPFYYQIFIIRPILVGLLPQSLYTVLHKLKQ